MGLDGNLLVEAGLFDADNVGNGAEPFQAVSAHHDAELGRVVEHDAQVGVLGQKPDVLNHLVFGLGHHEGRSDDQKVESLALGMLGQRHHFRG